MEANIPSRAVDSPTRTVKFTLSLSPSLSRGNFDLLAQKDVVERLLKFADRIHDINFTCHIEPFMRDAHGVYLTPEENEVHLTQMLALQKRTGIRVSPVFNDIYVPNTSEQLDRFLASFEPLYQRGIRSLTIPHVLWMKMKPIRESFPGLHIKTTALRRVRTAQEFWNMAEAGFDYVNIDRLLVRDLIILKEVRKAQEKFYEHSGKHVLISIIDGEGCPGTCAIIEEHHQHTLTHPGINLNQAANLDAFRLPQYLSCLSDGEPELNWLTSVGLPFYYKEFSQVCSLIDVIKLPGRRTILSLSDGLKKLEMLEIWDEGLAPDAPEDLARMASHPAIEPLIEKWRKATPNCRFQCWRCTICQEILARKICD